MVSRSENLDRTVEDKTTTSENLDRTVEDTAANCLMLLSRVGERSGRGGGDGESRVFRCKTCMQEFSSFQALGGHRASHNAANHKKTINNSNSGEEQTSSVSSLSVVVKKKVTKKTRPHRCPICGLEFTLGQALGGHMRKHRNEENNSSGAALVTRSFFPEAAAKTTMFTTLKKSSSGKRVACFDLGSDSMDSTINLKLELGRTIY